MNCLKIIQLSIVFTFATSVFASDIRLDLRAATEGMKYANCVTNMDKITGILDNLKVDDYKNEIKKSGHKSLLDELFEYKLTIHKTLRNFHANQGIEKSCSDSTRHALRAIRTAEDYVSEHQYRNYKDTMKFPDNTFENGNPNVQRNPEFAGFDLNRDLRSGDVILSRGNAFTSAAISSLGEFDTQFSHMSLVYKKPNGEIWTVEAHIEIGSVARPLQKHIDDKNYRTMVYRFDDAEVAAKAAEFIFKKVKNASDTTGNILYDFGFDQDDNEQLFCSETVSYAFDHASNGKIKLPLFRSRLMDRKPEFVKMLGIKASESFIPADIEVDPRFKIISEWRNAAVIQDNLQKDSVLQTMYRWNDELDYQMIQGSSKDSFLYRNVAYPLRRVPGLKKFFVKKMPLNMSRSLIGYFGVLESVGELLQEQVQAVEVETIKQRGFPLLKSEKYELLEKFRIKDLESKKKKLHKMYKPR